MNLILCLASVALALFPRQSKDAPPPVIASFVADLAAWIDEKPGADLEKLRASFSEPMSKALAKPAIETVLTPLRDEGDVSAELADVIRDGAVTTYVYLLEQKHSLWCTTIALDRDSKVAGWYVKPAPRRESRAELLTQTKALAGDWALAFTLYGADQAEVEHVELASRERLFPLGSIFKLYVLAEVARQTAEGKLRLDQDVLIDEALKSLPSGEMQNLRAGHKVKLRQMASQMIAISDNTAADHLLHLVGRENVEAHLAEYFNSAPERNRPFCSTLEMFAIKSCGKEAWHSIFGVDDLDSVAHRWRDAKVDERRDWLKQIDALWPDRKPSERRGAFGIGYELASTTAKDHTEIEWLAHPNDIVKLVDAAQRNRLVSPEASKLFLELYAAGQPIYVVPKGVRAQGFKGGSETSVLAFSSRVVLDDGRAVIGCLMRTGFDPADARTTDSTLALFTAWIRNLFERDAAAKTAPSGR